MQSGKSVIVWAALALFCGVSLTALASERYLGTINSTTTAKNNGNNTNGIDGGSILPDGGVATFAIPSVTKVSVQCDGTAYVTVGASSSETSTTATGVKVGADQLFPTSTPYSNGTAYISTVCGAGSCACKVWERKGDEG